MEDPSQIIIPWWVTKATHSLFNFKASKQEKLYPKIIGLLDSKNLSLLTTLDVISLGNMVKPKRGLVKALKI